MRTMQGYFMWNLQGFIHKFWRFAARDTIFPVCVSIASFNIYVLHSCASFILLALGPARNYRWNSGRNSSYDCSRLSMIYAIYWLNSFLHIYCVYYILSYLAMCLSNCEDYSSVSKVANISTSRLKMTWAERKLVLYKLMMFSRLF